MADIHSPFSPCRRSKSASSDFKRDTADKDSVPAEGKAMADPSGLSKSPEPTDAPLAQKSGPPPYDHHRTAKLQTLKTSAQLLAPVSVSVPRCSSNNTTFWYIIECEMEDGKQWQLSRYYVDFSDLQDALFRQFPKEAGKHPKLRKLPYFPGVAANVTDATSNSRIMELERYIRSFISLPPEISKCQPVKELFAPRPGDVEIETRARQERGGRSLGVSIPPAPTPSPDYLA